MPSAIRLHHTHIGQATLLAVNAVLLVLIGLMVLSPVFDLDSGWTDDENLFALLMLIGLSLIPVSLLLSTYFVKGDPLACPICKVVAAYNIVVAVFLFAHVAVAQNIGDLDLAYSTIIGIVAVVNALVLIMRVKTETAAGKPAQTHHTRQGM